MLLLVVISLDQLKIPIWLRLLGIILSVILMFRGELWPSATLRSLFNDIKTGHRFYPAITLSLIERECASYGPFKDKLCEIVYKYTHNFNNPDLTSPDKILEDMLEELCKEILKRQRCLNLEI